MLWSGKMFKRSSHAVLIILLNGYCFSAAVNQIDKSLQKQVLYLKKTLVFIMAGPSGSGKSTLTGIAYAKLKNLLADELIGYYKMDDLSDDFIEKCSQLRLENKYKDLKYLRDENFALLLQVNKRIANGKKIILIDTVFGTEIEKAGFEHAEFLSNLQQCTINTIVIGCDEQRLIERTQKRNELAKSKTATKEEKENGNRLPPSNSLWQFSHSFECVPLRTSPIDLYSPMYSGQLTKSPDLARKFSFVSESDISNFSLKCGTPSLISHAAQEAINSLNLEDSRDSIRLEERFKESGFLIAEADNNYDLLLKDEALYIVPTIFPDLTLFNNDDSEESKRILGQCIVDFVIKTIKENN